MSTLRIFAREKALDTRENGRCVGENGHLKIHMLKYAIQYIADKGNTKQLGGNGH